MVIRCLRFLSFWFLDLECILIDYSKLLTGDSQPDMGTESTFVEEWGEQMVSKSQPVVVTLNLASTILKNAQTLVRLIDNILD